METLSGLPRPGARRPYIKEMVVKYRRRPIPRGAPCIGRRIDMSFDAYCVFMDLCREPREHVYAIHLAGDNTILSTANVSVGSLTEAPCSLGQLFRGALLAGAAAVLVVHNHPSGSPEPSPADLRLLEELCEWGRRLDIKLVDFVIVGDDRYWSASDKEMVFDGRFRSWVNPVPVPGRRGRPPKALPKAAAS